MSDSSTKPRAAPAPIRFGLEGPGGTISLAARIDLPAGPPRAYALLVHGYTCSMDLAITRRIAEGLAGEGLAVLRFDLPGHGKSGGVFADTNFSKFRAAVLAAVDYMRANYNAPTVLVGHSLGGAALLEAASEIPEAKAVATIGTPADVGEVVRLIGASPNQIREQGSADIEIDGHKFTIRRQFLEDAAHYQIAAALPGLRKALLIMHAPLDEIVGIDHAARLYAAAKHPKSFISLDHAGHLFADEPVAVGGDDLGPSPYDYLSIALGACKSMTLRMYSRHKGLDLGRISVEVSHGKVAAEHCEDCSEVAAGRSGRIDRFECLIAIDGPVADEVRERLVEIAEKCPVHKTLQQSVAIVTRVGESEKGS
jgi:uncharacterized OsmC-like protein/alpha/beta superfamily hydrolase